MKLENNKAYQIRWQNKEQLTVIVNFLWSKGFHYNELSVEKFIEEWFTDHYYYIVIYPDDKSLGGNHSPCGSLVLLTMGDLFTAEWPVSIIVKLNDSYTAVVTKEQVQVGCQTFTHSAVLELAAAVNKINS